MSFKNFIPTLWAEGVQRELERYHGWKATCNMEYEGLVEKMGDEVIIPWAVRPTIKTGGIKTVPNLSSPESAKTVDVTMQIDQMAYFNYEIDDIDKKQAAGTMEGAFKAETTEGMADVMDVAIAKLAFSKGVQKANTTSTNIKLVAGTASTNEINICDALLEGREKLSANDVKRSTPIDVFLPPWAVTLYKKEMGLGRETNAGDELLKKGIVDIFDGMNIRETNNIATEEVSSANQYGITMKTRNAIAFANPIIYSEPIRSHEHFADILRGYTGFGCKVIRPKEMYVLNYTK